MCHRSLCVYIGFTVDELTQCLISRAGIWVADMDEQLNLSLVQCLDILTTAGHFGRAAQYLHITPPAMTQAISRLEKQVGIKLVDRRRHPIVLTPAGERFMAKARPALDYSREALEAAHGIGREHLTVGFIDASPEDGNRLLSRYHALHPQVTVEYRQLPWHQQTAAVVEGRVDVSLARPPHSRADVPILDVRAVCVEPRVVGVAANSRLAGRASLWVRDLDDSVVVTASSAEQRWVQWWAIDPRPNSQPVRYGPSVSTIAEAVAHVSTAEHILITARSVAEGIRHPGVVFIPLVDAEHCRVDLCTRRTDTRPVIEALRVLVNA